MAIFSSSEAKAMMAMTKVWALSQHAYSTRIGWSLDAGNVHRLTTCVQGSRKSGSRTTRVTTVKKIWNYDWLEYKEEDRIVVNTPVLLRATCIKVKNSSPFCETNINVTHNVKHHAVKYSTMQNYLLYKQMLWGQVCLNINQPKPLCMHKFVL